VTKCNAPARRTPAMSNESDTKSFNTAAGG
jgi:hypothetical protein